MRAVEFIAENVTPQELHGLEDYLDQFYKTIGIDITLRGHFIDRVNDSRNGKPITVGELARLFREEFKEYNTQIAELGPEAQAVLSDYATRINVPFVLKWDSEAKELDLIPKTAMRKKEFSTSNKVFPIR